MLGYFAPKIVRPLPAKRCVKLIRQLRRGGVDRPCEGDAASEEEGEADSAHAAWPRLAACRLRHSSIHGEGGLGR